MTDPTKPLSASAAKQGWYLDLTIGANSSWRVTEEPVGFNGIVTFADLAPTSDTCSQGATSNLYAIDFGAGVSILLNNTNGVVAYVSFSNMITDVKIDSVPPPPNDPRNPVTTKKPEILVCDSNSKCTTPSSGPLVTSYTARLLNWREIPLAD